MWRVGRWALITLVLLVTLGGVAAALDGNPRGLIAIAPWVLIILLWFVVIRWSGWLQAWQVRRSDPNVEFPFTYELGQVGLKVRCHTTDVEIKWTGLLGVREAPTYFAFYYNRRCAYHLPKRAIIDVPAAREYIRDALPQNEFSLDPRGE